MKTSNLTKDQVVERARSATVLSAQLQVLISAEKWNDAADMVGDIEEDLRQAGDWLEIMCEKEEG